MKNLDGANYIDLTQLPSNFEIPISCVQIEEKNLDRKEKQNKFSFEEVYVDDASSSIYFSQHENKILVLIYGPREVKYRDKLKIDEAIVEVYSKYPYERSNLLIKLENKSINNLIQNFCESLILLDAYPRCQINIHLNIISIHNEKLVKYC